MQSINDFLQSSFNNQLEQWEMSLKKELKLEDVSSKLTKKITHDFQWPVLSVSSQEFFLPSQESWKKSSQTYYAINPKSFKKYLEDDLAHGVKNFFFFAQTLTPTHTQDVLSVLAEKDVSLFLLGSSQSSQDKKSKLILEDESISGRSIHDIGGSNVQELAYIIKKFINNPEATHVFCFLDSNFFSNIAKIRALRLLITKVVMELGRKSGPRLVGLNSYRDWTLFERHSNMLRNEIAVASAFIGGADDVQSSGYQTLIEMELDIHEAQEDARSKRMARNTSHILALESMLGVVADAASGSYHLESLTQAYAQAAWELMQKNLKQSDQALLDEAQSIAKLRLDELNTRKLVVAGVNDFTDVKDQFPKKITAKKLFFRPAYNLEALRLEATHLASRPKVSVLVFGNMAALNARVSFAKNYFEVLGLEVNILEFNGPKKIEADIAVICAKDEDYQQLNLFLINAPLKFVAGKTQVAGWENIFLGQDIYLNLKSLFEKWESR